MGQDIHASIEERDVGSWWSVAQGIHVQRHYELFGALGSARGQTRLLQLRGFPEDASYETTTFREDWGLDGHSDSWVTLEEAEQVLAVVADDWWQRWITLMRSISQPTRVVFWFDN